MNSEEVLCACTEIATNNRRGLRRLESCLEVTSGYFILVVEFDDGSEGLFLCDVGLQMAIKGFSQEVFKRCRVYAGVGSCRVRVEDLSNVGRIIFVKVESCCKGL